MRVAAPGTPINSRARRCPINDETSIQGDAHAGLGTCHPHPHPARRRGGVRDDQLSAPTPCAGSSIGDLLDHVDGFALAFTAAAAKTPLPSTAAAPSADASRLGPEWRERIPERLAALAAAWRDDSAWSGMTEAGGQSLPGELAGVIALDELILHGWDIAVASGQPFSSEPRLIEAALGFVQQTVARNPNGTPGLFGPPVPVSDDAPLLHRLLGLAGRDHAWRGDGSRN